MDQAKLLNILKQTKEDLTKSLQEALHRRFINDARRFRECIAKVSIAMQKAEAPDLSLQDINNIATELLTVIVIDDLVFMSKEFREQ
jgi:mannose/fructose/N-acetylgalactosamine-specific phosphotransferase system component IID